MAEVVPILQERGVCRAEYESDTLRGNLGLPFDENRHTVQRRELDELQREAAEVAVPVTWADLAPGRARGVPVSRDRPLRPPYVTRAYVDLVDF